MCWGNKLVILHVISKIIKNTFYCFSTSFFYFHYRENFKMKSKWHTEQNMSLSSYKTTFQSKPKVILDKNAKFLNENFKIHVF